MALTLSTRSPSVDFTRNFSDPRPGILDRGWTIWTAPMVSVILALFGKCWPCLLVPRTITGRSPRRGREARGKVSPGQDEVPDVTRTRVTWVDWQIYWRHAHGGARGAVAVRNGGTSCGVGRAIVKYVF
jgi:hypothetical protein